MAVRQVYSWEMDASVEPADLAEDLARRERVTLIRGLEQIEDLVRSAPSAARIADRLRGPSYRWTDDVFTLTFFACLDDTHFNKRVGVRQYFVQIGPQEQVYAHWQDVAEVFLAYQEQPEWLRQYRVQPPESLDPVDFSDGVRLDLVLRAEPWIARVDVEPVIDWMVLDCPPAVSPHPSITVWARDGAQFRVQRGGRGLEPLIERMLLTEPRDPDPAVPAQVVACMCSYSLPYPVEGSAWTTPLLDWHFLAGEIAAYLHPARLVREDDGAVRLEFFTYESTGYRGDLWGRCEVVTKWFVRAGGGRPTRIESHEVARLRSDPERSSVQLVGEDQEHVVHPEWESRMSIRWLYGKQEL
ncbi:hypothetical protein KIH74_14780 [Kineosporia sp. J2-2]|uniref:Uncharacterized protein n=1 Tax=Kineosporia corallincola TaxID=2835133 RepID=A0ABS5TJF9_9ACTN|nr:hypothetical protein [Kineosporia corallincola]MBT0770203.1 hypothetical protein [Kineosporia corallincola]